MQSKIKSVSSTSKINPFTPLLFKSSATNWVQATNVWHLNYYHAFWSPCFHTCLLPKGLAYNMAKVVFPLWVNQTTLHPVTASCCCWNTMQAPIKSYIAGPALFSNSITLLPPWTPPPTPLLTVLLALLDFLIPYTCQVSVLAVHSAPVCLAVLFPLFSSNIRPFPDHIIKGPGHFLFSLCHLLHTIYHYWILSYLFGFWFMICFPHSCGERINQSHGRFEAQQIFVIGSEKETRLLKA